MILVMISAAVTIVTAISADSDMTMSVLATITESITDIKKNEYIFGYRSTQTLYIKRKTIGRPAHPHLESSGADPGEVKWVNFHPPPPFF